MRRIAGEQSGRPPGIRRQVDPWCGPDRSGGQYQRKTPRLQYYWSRWRDSRGCELQCLRMARGSARKEDTTAAILLVTLEGFPRVRTSMLADGQGLCQKGTQISGSCSFRTPLLWTSR